MHTYTIYLDSPLTPWLTVDAEFMNDNDAWEFIEFTVDDQVVAMVKRSLVIAVAKKAVA